jgi:DNA-binding response OmpR family regulator
MAMEVGANDYFVKPINKSIFAAKVKAIIRRYRLDKQQIKEICPE